MSIPNPTEHCPDDCSTVLIQVLTCAKSPEDRLLSAKQQLEDFLPRQPYRIVMGYTGSDREASQIYDAPKNHRYMKRPLTEGEIAIYASHRKAMAEFLQSPYAATLILEDDFKLVMPEMVKSALEHANELFTGSRNLIKLFDYHAKKTSSTILDSDTIDELPLVKHSSPRAGMVAYIISREGAERFLARESIYRMIDEDIKYFWELGLNIWSIPNNPIVDNSSVLGGSLVDDERQYRRAQKTLRRSIYGNFLTLHRKSRNLLENLKYNGSKNND